MRGGGCCIRVRHSACLERLLLCLFFLLFRSLVLLVNADPVELECEGRPCHLVMQFLEDPADVRVVRLLIKFEGADVGQEGLEYLRDVFAEAGNSGG